MDLVAGTTIGPVCASSLSTIPPGAPRGAGVLYVAYCEGSQGRIARVDLGSGKGRDVASFDATQAQVSIVDYGDEFVVWTVLKDPGGLAPITREVGLWDAALPAPVHVDPEDAFPRSYRDPRGGWVGPMAYVGRGRVLASWEFHHNSQQLGIVDVAKAAQVWNAPSRIAADRITLRATPDRSRFLVLPEAYGGSYAIEIASSDLKSIKALDRALSPTSLPYGDDGWTYPFDGTHVVMKRRIDTQRGTHWVDVDIATGALRTLGEAVTAHVYDDSAGAAVGADGTTAAIVKGAAATDERLISFVPTGGAPLFTALAPARADAVRYVAPKGVYAIVETAPADKEGPRELWVARPGQEPVRLAALARGDVGRFQQLADGVLYYAPSARGEPARVLRLDANGAVTATNDLAGERVEPLQTSWALVDKCIYEVKSDGTPSPQPSGCLEGVDKSNLSLWMTPIRQNGIRAFVVTERVTGGVTLHLFRY